MRKVDSIFIVDNLAFVIFLYKTAKFDARGSFFSCVCPTSRARKGNASENLSTLQKLALQMINDIKDKLSLKKRRVKAAWDMEYLKKILV